MELRDDVVDELVQRGPTTTQQTVLLIERGHRHEPGVERSTLEVYVDALEGRRDYEFDAEGFRADLEGALVDDETWTTDDALYRIGDDRVSRYPKRWHDELGGSDDVAAFVSLLNGSAYVDQGGVNEDALLDVVAAVGRTSVDDAKAELEALREEGVVVEDADQHPHAGVYLADEAEGLRDPALDDS
ncbi:hypothetical protein HWV07_19325 [Natronomonas salina]|uniref:hypothetical protein n=1 Tax=Natronomonas salina TaxID=1710540 RepID=UPI0015B5C355|nr:hypothetical protein [Natronomonas salina]QLD91078.1 hypothetical protein HWV07_19325 [Natronomonas salina]